MCWSVCVLVVAIQHFTLLEFCKDQCRYSLFCNSVAATVWSKFCCRRFLFICRSSANGLQLECPISLPVSNTCCHVPVYVTVDLDGCF